MGMRRRQNLSSVSVSQKGSKQTFAARRIDWILSPTSPSGMVQHKRFPVRLPLFGRCVELEGDFVGTLNVALDLDEEERFAIDGEAGIQQMVYVFGTYAVCSGRWGELWQLLPMRARGGGWQFFS